jgi:hypothetical protein
MQARQRGSYYTMHSVPEADLSVCTL